MASDFEFMGFQNHQAEFRENATGTIYWVQIADEDGPVELQDGDRVVISQGGQRVIWSIRESRGVGWP